MPSMSKEYPSWMTALIVSDAVRDMLVKEQIDKQSFALLDDSDLKEMGIEAKEDREKLLAAAATLTKQTEEDDKKEKKEEASSSPAIDSEKKNLADGDKKRLDEEDESAIPSPSKRNIDILRAEVTAQNQMVQELIKRLDKKDQEYAALDARLIALEGSNSPASTNEEEKKEEKKEGKDDNNEAEKKEVDDAPKGKKQKKETPALTLYAAAMSQPSRAVLWYIKLNKIEGIEIKMMDFKKGEHLTPEFTALTPFQSVPLLRVDGKESLVESSAILSYLAALNKGQYVPTDAWEKAKMKEAMALHDDTVRMITQKWFRPAALPKAMGAPLKLSQSRAIVAATAGDMKWTLQYVDDRLGKNGGFMSGSSFSLADFLLAGELTQLGFLKSLWPEDFDVANYKNIVKFLDGLKVLDGYAEFMAPCQMFEKVMAAPWAPEE